MAATALPLSHPDAAETLIPPLPKQAVARLGLIGMGLVALGVGLAIVGMGDSVGFGATIRLVLVSFGILFSAGAITHRPTWPNVWLIASGTAWLATYAFPPHWDSARLLLRVLSVVSLVAGGLLLLPIGLRRSFIIAGVGFHASSLLCATTWPDPTPWLTNQVGQRIYLPFMQFVYLRNAYHFYSPDPGPASHVFVLLTYETPETDPKTGKPKTISEWVTFPRRYEQTKDPLGQTYYRRLSLSESVVRSYGDGSIGYDERQQARTRRLDVAMGNLAGVKRIPQCSPNYELEMRWCMPPTADISRYILPSFAKHIAVENSHGIHKVVNVRIYRAEHRIVTSQYFVKEKMDPYHPSLYRVYFLGDYDAEGQLKDSQDPMLYWLIPIEPDLSQRHDWNKPSPDQYKDMLTEHAGFEFPWSQLRP
ncbi:MAG: hypothetical protein ACRC8S_18415 [Fimbriiglobus sp.]